MFARGGVDRIQVSTPVAAALVRVSAAVSGRRRPQVVYLVHGFHFQTEFWRLRDVPWYVFERALAPFTDHYQVITHADEAVVRRWGRSATYVPGVGVDVDRVRFDGDRAAAERELALEPAATRALFIGQLSKQKGMPVLAECARAAPDVRWLVVGEGPLHDELDALPNVDVLGQRDSIAAPLAAADVYVSFSTAKGCRWPSWKPRPPDCRSSQSRTAARSSSPGPASSAHSPHQVRRCSSTRCAASPARGVGGPACTRHGRRSTRELVDDLLAAR